MAVTDLIKRITEMPKDENFSWTTVRDEIHEEYATASTDERVLLLRAYFAVMDAFENSIADTGSLSAFKNARLQDYRLLLVSECVDGKGHADAHRLDKVTAREVAAGRMKPDDELRAVTLKEIKRRSSGPLARLFGRK